MNVHRAVATNSLWGKLNHDPRALNAIIRAAILARLVGHRPTPCEVGTAFPYCLPTKPPVGPMPKPDPPGPPPGAPDLPPFGGPMCRSPSGGFLSGGPAAPFMPVPQLAHLAPHHRQTCGGSSR